MFAIVEFLAGLLFFEFLHVEALHLLHLILTKTNQIVNKAGCFLDHNDISLPECLEKFDERIVCMGSDLAAELGHSHLYLRRKLLI